VVCRCGNRGVELYKCHPSRVGVTPKGVCGGDTIDMRFRFASPQAIECRSSRALMALEFAKQRMLQRKNA